VVLPFDNLSPDADNAYFADGLTEELIADLSRVRALRVISRTSAMHFKGTTKSLPEIAREVNVRYALEGSVRRAGTSLRITAQLIDAETDAHLWAEKYVGSLDDVFDLQERLSRRIVDALRLTLTPDEHDRLASRDIPDVEAYALYLRATQEMYRLTESALDLALQLVERALDRTGPNALLMATAAEITWWLHDQGIRPTPETLERADALATRALELAPDLARRTRPRATSSGVASTRRPPSGTSAGRSSSVRGMPTVVFSAAYVLGEVGRSDEALRLAERAAAMDPLHWLSHCASPWPTSMRVGSKAPCPMPPACTRSPRRFPRRPCGTGSSSCTPAGPTRLPRCSPRVRLRPTGAPCRSSSRSSGPRCAGTWRRMPTATASSVSSARAAWRPYISRTT
jgi:eukaryotic-like serine/threonine-protein kinase